MGYLCGLIAGDPIRHALTSVQFNITDQPRDVITRRQNLRADVSGHQGAADHDRYSCRHCITQPVERATSRTPCEARVSVTLASVDLVVKVRSNTTFRLP